MVRRMMMYPYAVCRLHVLQFYSISPSRPKRFVPSIMAIQRWPMRRTTHLHRLLDVAHEFDYEVTVTLMERLCAMPSYSYGLYSYAYIVMALWPKQLWPK